MKKLSVLVIAVAVVVVVVFGTYSGWWGNFTGRVTGDFMGLVAHYKMDGNADDDRGRNPPKDNWLKFTGGKVNQAGIFDHGMFVEIPNSPDFDKGGGFTYSAIIQPKAFEKDHQIVMGHETPFISVRKDGRVFGYTVDAGIARGESVLEYGKWYHVVLIWSKEKPLKLYINGELDGQSSKISDSVLDENKKFYIGKRKEVDGYPFIGLIDEVKIWNYALTEKRIKAEYEAAFG